MELKGIKYKGDKINKATAKSIYELYDESIDGVLFTGSYRQCWIRRAYLTQYETKTENVEKYVIRINEELTKEKELEDYQLKLQDYIFKGEKSKYYKEINDTWNKIINKLPIKL